MSKPFLAANTQHLVHDSGVHSGATKRIDSGANVLNKKRKIRPAPSDWMHVDLQVWDPRIHEYEIKQFAKGMEKEEILSYYGLDYEVLPENDKWFFNTTFQRGRLEAKRSAVEALFNNMNSSGRTGIDSSLAYLTRFGNERWQHDSGQTSSAPKGLKIVFTDEEGNEI